MSTGMTLFGGKLPARLQNREMDETTKNLVGSGGGSGRRISIKGGVFRMIVDGKQAAESDDRSMNIVVVKAASHVNRQYYEGMYEEGVVTSATCYSQDGVTPDAGASNPQSKACDGCTQNISGSGQGEARACRYQQRLAVVLEGEIDGPVYQLALPATSLFGKGEPNNTKLPLQAYARYLAANGLPITEVVTEMRFDTKSATPKLTFKAVRPLEDDEADSVKENAASAEAIQAVTLTVFKQDGAKGTTKPKAKAIAAPVEGDEEEAPAPKPKASPFGKKTPPAPAAEEAEEVAEPKVAPKAAKSEAPAGKRPVSEVIADWDDE